MCWISPLFFLRPPIWDIPWCGGAPIGPILFCFCIFQPQFWCFHNVLVCGWSLYVVYFPQPLGCQVSLYIQRQKYQTYFATLGNGKPISWTWQLQQYTRQPPIKRIYSDPRDRLVSWIWLGSHPPFSPELGNQPTWPFSQPLGVEKRLEPKVPGSLSVTPPVGHQFLVFFR